MQQFQLDLEFLIQMALLLQEQAQLEWLVPEHLLVINYLKFAEHSQQVDLLVSQQVQVLWAWHQEQLVLQQPLVLVVELVLAVQLLLALLSLLELPVVQHRDSVPYHVVLVQ
jgi:hypothetical protein